MEDTLLNDFLSECREHLEGIETDLLAIEETGKNADRELINKVFRAAHSIKGGAGFFNLDTMKTLAHKIETVLDMVRMQTIIPQPEVINLLLISFDQLRDLVNNPATQAETDISVNVAALNDLVEQHTPGPQKNMVQQTVILTTPDGNRQFSVSAADVESARKEAQYIYLLEYDMLHDFDRKGKSPVELLKSLSSMGVIIDAYTDIMAIGTLDDEPATVVPVKIIYRTVVDPEYIETAAEVAAERITLLCKPGTDLLKAEAAANPSMSSGSTLNEHKPTANVISPVETPPLQQEEPSVTATVPVNERENAGPSQSAQVAETVRINVEVLDQLMSHAGELVLGRNQLLDAVNRGDARATRLSAQRISFVTSELQEAVMRTRLQPIGNVFNKFTRVVRDMAARLQKEIRLQMEGREVELDKTIVEGLSDPLTHMVRNAADHGLESSAERQRCGKPVIGTIVLRAFHEAGQVTIEVSDDGKGIDAAQIGAKALSMGLLTKERLGAMTDAEKMELIFLPGLSTARTVTETSGRGVGMDVVKTNIDRLDGKVEIRSVSGKGTTFCIKLPLTLAIIPSLIVRENDERYAIPQVNVAELVRIPAAQAKNRIQVVGDSETLVLRGTVLPFVRFSDVLGITSTYTNPDTGMVEIDRRSRLADRRSPKVDLTGEPVVPINQHGEETRAAADRRYHAASDLNIVIVAAGDLHYGIAVAELCNSEEIVVKPIGRHLKGLQEYAGATIMGDGAIALILDAAGLAHKAGIDAIHGIAETSEDSTANDNGRALLMINNRYNEPCALPLDIVQRVERITAADIELRGDRRTMQYRGASLPLVELADIESTVKESLLDGEPAVAVANIGGHEVGFLGLMPVSVIETWVPTDTSIHKRKGVNGSAVINDTTVLMIDLPDIVDSVFPDWQTDTPETLPTTGAAVLLAEDSDFFREQVITLVEEIGMRVIAAKDGQEAWELLNANVQSIWVVVTDIEMPHLDGMGLSAKIRADGRFQSLPIIAVTSLAGEEEIARGKAAGIDEYQIKLDRDQLQASLKRIWASTTNETIKK